VGSFSNTAQLQPEGELDSHIASRPPSGSLALSIASSQATEVQTVLCVGGDFAMQLPLRQALAQYDLVFASSGYDALRIHNARVFDLYIVDYWLPDWSGISLCREIRKADRHVPVCFCTAATQPHNQRRAERAGGNAYFHMPVDPELVSAEISVLMQLMLQRREAAMRAGAAAIEKELRRRAAAPAGMSLEKIEAALMRSARSKAKQAFLQAGGTLAAFERTWEPLWHEAWAGCMG
jgi:DNA-binding response OmpR family regulator